MSVHIDDAWGSPFETSPQPAPAPPPPSLPPREPREPREPPSLPPRESREPPPPSLPPREPRALRELREPRESRESRESRERREPRAAPRDLPDLARRESDVLLAELQALRADVERAARRQITVICVTAILALLLLVSMAQVQARLNHTSQLLLWSARSQAVR